MLLTSGSEMVLWERETVGQGNEQRHVQKKYKLTKKTTTPLWSKIAKISNYRIK